MMMRRFLNIEPTGSQTSLSLDMRPPRIDLAAARTSHDRATNHAIVFARTHDNRFFRNVGRPSKQLRARCARALCFVLLFVLFVSIV